MQSTRAQYIADFRGLLFVEGREVTVTTPGRDPLPVQALVAGHGPVRPAEVSQKIAGGRADWLTVELLAEDLPAAPTERTIISVHGAYAGEWDLALAVPSGIDGAAWTLYCTSNERRRR